MLNGDYHISNEDKQEIINKGTYYKGSLYGSFLDFCGFASQSHYIIRGAHNYNWHYDWHCICRETSHREMCENEISLSEYNEYGSSGGWDYEEIDSGGKKKVY